MMLGVRLGMVFCVLFCKQKTAYEMRISDWSSDVCSSDLGGARRDGQNLHATSRQRSALKCPRTKQELHNVAFVRLKPVELRCRHRTKIEPVEIGRASCRERVCQYV